MSINLSKLGMSFILLKRFLTLHHKFLHSYGQIDLPWKNVQRMWKSQVKMTPKSEKHFNFVKTDFNFILFAITRRFFAISWFEFNFQASKLCHKAWRKKCHSKNFGVIFCYWAICEEKLDGFWAVAFKGGKIQKAPESKRRQHLAFVQTTCENWDSVKLSSLWPPSFSNGTLDQSFQIFLELKIALWLTQYILWVN